MAGKKEEKNAMSVLSEHIKNGIFKNVYLLFGDERYLVNQYRDNLLEAITDVNDTMNFIKYVGAKPDTDEIIEFCETMPFLADRRVVLVEGSGYFKSACEGFPERIETLPDSSILVFVESEVDKRSKLYKVVDKIGETLEYNTPNERTLLVWTKGQFKSAGMNIEDVAIYSILDAVGSDMNAIKNEIEKVISYCIGKDTVSNKDVMSVCSENPESKIFDMMEAISTKNQPKALKLYADLLENREPAMRILYMLARQFNILLKAKIAKEDKLSDAQMSKVLEVQPWLVKKYSEQCKSYTYDRLKEIVDLCQDVDYKIKRGLTTDSIAVELLIVELSM